MKILFIASTTAGLYKEIQKEMEMKGNEVVFIKDQLIKFDPHSKAGLSLPVVKGFLWKRRIKKYWANIFDSRKEINQPFDLLFALSGCSVTKELVDLLRISNPNIKTVLYTWDGCGYYDFSRHLAYMDKSYTFDLLDSQMDRRWRLLPIYYRSVGDNKKEELVYDLFSVGSNHSGRYPFIKRILPQTQGLTCCFRIISPELILGIKERVYLLLMSKRKREEREAEILFSQGRENEELLLRSGIPMDEYLNLMLSSRCILDDQREGQSGLTARFMWALGAKKKIITTNKWALDYAFVSDKQVSIISKSCPEISRDFICEIIKDEDLSNVEPFEISNWVDEILKWN